jgi:hypothetical protein
MTYQSTVRCESAVLDGVCFEITRMSFGRRMSLVRELRAIAARADYHNAGSSAGDAVERTLIEAEADRVYMHWGLARVEGLEIDGVPATAETLFSAGPEPLCREIVQRIRAECFLSADEQKN